MTTFSAAWDLVRARLEGAGSGISIPLRFKGDQQEPLPDTPAVFAFINPVTERVRGPAAFGGGRGANLYRNPLMIEAYVFSPIGEGLTICTDYAETIAARLRSFRSGDVSCFSATVHPVGDGSNIKPPGFDSEVNNYQCAVVEVEMHFDQTG
jgi:hypothetical protein